MRHAVNVDRGGIVTHPRSNKGENMNYFKQCELQNGVTKEISWIPEKFAIKNKALKIKINGIFEDGWQVNEVYNLRKSEEDVLRDEQLFKHQREVSDL